MIKQVKTCPVLYIDKQEVRNIKIDSDRSLYSSKNHPTPRGGLVNSCLWRGVNPKSFTPLHFNFTACLYLTCLSLLYSRKSVIYYMFLGVVQYPILIEQAIN